MWAFSQRLCLLVASSWLLSTGVHGVRRVQQHHYEQNAKQSRYLLTVEEELLNATTRRNLPSSLPTSPEDHRVTHLPLLDDSSNSQLRHYAGHLPASESDDKYLFYWLFYPPSDVDITDTSIPLIVWLNGGPGCSSMDGLFLEHGAIQWNQDYTKLQLNPYSWHLAPAFVVYIDQPVGTGLSYTKSRTYPDDDTKVNADFHYFMKQFLLLHSNVFLNDSKSTNKRPLFGSGESHAGHYWPSMIEYIHRQQQTKSDVQIRFTGAAIGNGWVDPFHQYSAARAAFGHGLIDQSQVNALSEKERTCQMNLNNHNYRQAVCFGLLDDIVEESQGSNSANFKVSQYDVRTWESRHGAREFPPGHKVVETYLGGWPSSNNNQLPTNKDEVLQAIHASSATVNGQRYQECTDPPYNALSHQDGLGVVNEVVTLLQNNVQLLFFNGIMDLICNHVGNEILLEKLPWEHANDWRLATRYSWSHKSGGSPTGYMKEYANLKYLKILNAGHMVPLDVPEVALEMIRTFVYDRSFDAYEQRLDRALPNDTCEPCPSCDVVPDAKPSPTAPSAEDNAVLKYVIAHSWLGALLAVSFFLVVLLWVRRRQERAGAVRMQRMGSGELYELELKDQYRDQPHTNGEEDGEYSDEEPRPNGLYSGSNHSSSQASSSII